MVTYGLSRAPRRGAFIMTLDSPVRHFTIELGTKRNAVQWSVRSLVEWLSLFFFLGPPPGHPHSASPFSIIIFSFRSQNILDSNQVLLETLADATPPLPCFYPHSEWA